MIYLMSIVTLILCVGTSEAKSKLPKEDKNVTCVFKEFNFCYRTIGNLGAYVNVSSVQDARQLNDTCKEPARTFYSCMNQITARCPKVPELPDSVKTINNTVGQICLNGTKEEKAFLNSSACYNKGLDSYKQCLNKYDLKGKTDPTSVCCTNEKIVKCVKDAISKACGKTDAAETRKNLMKTYYSFSKKICSQYKCGACALISTSFWTVTILSVAFSFFNKLWVF